MVTETRVKAQPQRRTADELALSRVVAALSATGIGPADIRWLEKIYREAMALRRIARGG